MEDSKEDPLESGPQGLPPGYDPQVAPIRMTEEPASAQGIEDSSDTPRPSNGERYHYLGQSREVSQPNSKKNPTDVNLDSATLASPSGEEHDAP